MTKLDTYLYSHIISTKFDNEQNRTYCRWIIKQIGSLYHFVAVETLLCNKYKLFHFHMYLIALQNVSLN